MSIANMTTCGHNVVMKRKPDKSVKIAEFKAHLSQYLQGVREGNVLMVMDRQTPVALVAPVDEPRGRVVIARKPTGKWSDIKLPAPLKKPVDSVKFLLEDRESSY